MTAQVASLILFEPFQDILLIVNGWLGVPLSVPVKTSRVGSSLPLLRLIVYLL